MQRKNQPIKAGFRKSDNELSQASPTTQAQASIKYARDNARLGRRLFVQIINNLRKSSYARKKELNIRKMRKAILQSFR